MFHVEHFLLPRLTSPQQRESLSSGSFGNLSSLLKLHDVTLVEDSAIILVHPHAGSGKKRSAWNTLIKMFHVEHFCGKAIMRTMELAFDSTECTNDHECTKIRHCKS